MGPAAWRARREVGLTIPVVASLRPVRHLVYLCAIIPRPGAAWDDVAAEQPAFGHYQSSIQAIGHPDGMELFYHDCPSDLARWAAPRFRRQHWRVSRIERAGGSDEIQLDRTRWLYAHRAELQDVVNGVLQSSPPAAP